MRLFRNPWVWLTRITHRRGYGVHSPFAFAFITQVIYERTPFYAYASLSHLHPWWVRWFGLYPLSCCRLLFRLANYVHPSSVLMVDAGPLERAYVTAAVPGAELRVETTVSAAAADFVFVSSDRLSESLHLLSRMPEGGMMVLEGIYATPQSRSLWRALQADAHTGITFDLYVYGIAFFNRQMHKQHYIVNF